MSRQRSSKRSGRPHKQGNRPSTSRQTKDNGVWLYGTHPVLAALENIARSPRKLMATRQAAERIHEAHPDLPVQIQVTDSDSIAEMLPDGAVHQGMALNCAPLSSPHLEDLLTSSTDRSLLIVLDQVTDPHNVGAILRTAAVFGADAVVVQDRHAPPESGVLAKSASGALETMPLARINNLARALETMKDAGFWIAGLDGDADQTLDSMKGGRKSVLVLGAEGQGLRRLTAETCDMLVKIPMAPNSVGSLNVSNAAAVALYELTRLPGR